jgi:histidinol phosphatase-like enzyme
LEINGRLAEMLAAEGVTIAGWFWCPHVPDAGCTCRKPAPGLFFRARDELGVILEGSWIVGDRLSDMQAGREAGARSILVATGYGQTEAELPGRLQRVDHFVPTLREAAEVIHATPAERRRAQPISTPSWSSSRAAISRRAPKRSGGSPRSMPATW